MRKRLLLSFFLTPAFLIPTSIDFGQTGRPIPPGVREADKQTNAPIEPPANQPAKGADPAKLKQEAQELAQLSAAIPAKIDLLNHGQLPKELADELKRIEKLAKHLRSEVAP